MFSLQTRSQQWVDMLRLPKAMLRLCWHTYPTGFLGLIGLELFQSLIPLAQAWITKLLFDQLATSFLAGNEVSVDENLVS